MEYSKSLIIVYYDVGYYRFIIMYDWLAVKACLPVDNDYWIGIVEVEKINQVKKTTLK
jgi:hypothetical protein